MVYVCLACRCTDEQHHAETAHEQRSRETAEAAKAITRIQYYKMHMYVI